MAQVSAPPVASPPELTDLELVTRIRAGAGHLYAVLVRRHNQRLYRIARAIVRDDAEAEDVVQQAHVIAFRQLAGFRGDAPYGSWLTRIAVNEALGRIRSRRRLGLVPFDETDPALPARSTMAPADQITYGAEIIHLLERHIDDLPDALRSVFVMRDVEELDTAETAALLAISEAAVRVRLHRARQALQAAIADVIVAAPDAFHFAGARCERITSAVMAALGLADPA